MNLISRTPLLASAAGEPNPLEPGIGLLVAVATFVVLVAAVRYARTRWSLAGSAQGLLGGIIVVSAVMGAIATINWRWLAVPAAAIGSAVLVGAVAMGLAVLLSLLIWRRSSTAPRSASRPTGKVPPDAADEHEVP